MSAILSIIRNTLLALGAGIASKGWFTTTEWEQIVGVIIVIGVAAWKAAIRFKRNKS